MILQFQPLMPRRILGYFCKCIFIVSKSQQHCFSSGFRKMSSYGSMYGTYLSTIVWYSLPSLSGFPNAIIYVAESGTEKPSEQIVAGTRNSYKVVHGFTWVSAGRGGTSPTPQQTTDTKHKHTSMQAYFFLFSVSPFRTVVGCLFLARVGGARRDDGQQARESTGPRLVKY